MKGIVCKVCGYVSLEGMKDVCPSCGNKNTFEEKDDAYKMPDYKAETGETEKKHIPSIKVEKSTIWGEKDAYEVKVKIGEMLHPMLPEHHINAVFFYHENKYLGKMTFNADGANPAATIHLKDGLKGKIQVIENCNIHGDWYNEVNLD